MTDRISDLWIRQDDDANFSQPGVCATRMTSLERSVKRRNLIEYLAGGLVALVAGAGFLFALVAGLWDFAISALALLVGLFLILRHLKQNGGMRSAPELACRDYYRSQLVRQRDLLRSVPGWYLFPLVPGILALYASLIIRMTPIAGLASAIEGVALPLLATLAFFVFVCWLNLATAKRIDRQIASLDAQT